VVLATTIFFKNKIGWQTKYNSIHTVMCCLGLICINKIKSFAFYYILLEHLKDVKPKQKPANRQRKKLVKLNT